MSDKILEDLMAVIESRKDQSADSSYVASLFAKGTEKVAEKVGEEAVEAVIEAVKGDKDALTRESADLIFHLLVLLADQDIALDAVLQELESRKGVSGLDEKASRAS